MTTAYAFSDYKDCCHKHNLPRPAAIFPIYGLHWELKVHEKDKGLAVFSRVGRDDPTGFAAVEKIIPDIRKALGQENVDIVMYDKLSFADYKNNQCLKEANDVADPWYTGDFEATYRDIVAGCEGLLEYLGYR